MSKAGAVLEEVKKAVVGKDEVLVQVLLAILAGKQGLATNLDIAVSGSHPAAAASRADTAARLARRAV